METRAVISQRKVYFRVGPERVYSIREGVDKNLIDAIVKENYYSFLGWLENMSIPHVCQMVDLPDRYIQEFLKPQFKKYEYVKKGCLPPADKALIYFGLMRFE